LKWLSMPLFQEKVCLHCIALAAGERESVPSERGHCQGINKICCDGKLL
jgi:hypothetical protein